MGKVKIKKISFPSSLKYTEDIYDDNLNVFIELDDGSRYTVIVGTPKKFLTLMNRHEMDFLEPGYPFIIDRKLTMEVIKKAIHSDTQDDAYWLKLDHFSVSIKNDIFKKLQEDEDKAYAPFDRN